MKVIEKALKQARINTTNKPIPQKGWWGFNYRGNGYLMRYGHTMLVWNLENPNKYRIETSQTKTDRTGIKDAIKQLGINTSK